MIYAAYFSYLHVDILLLECISVNGNGWRRLSSTVCRVSWNSPRCFEPLWRTWMERQISTRLSPALPSAQAAMNARWSLHWVFCPTWGRPLPSNQIRSQSGRCGPTSRRASFQAWKHPSWKKSLESSIGNYSQVDAVLLFNVLGHIHTDDRKALFQKLMSRYLSDAAMIAVCCMCSNIRSVPAGIAVLMERWSDSLSRELIVTNSRKRYWRRGSFRVVFKHDFEARRDLSNPSDDVVKIIQMRSYHKTKSARLSTTYYTVSRTWMLRWTDWRFSRNRVKQCVLWLLAMDADWH